MEDERGKKRCEEKRKSKCILSLFSRSVPQLALDEGDCSSTCRRPSCAVIGRPSSPVVWIGNLACSDSSLLLSFLLARCSMLVCLLLARISCSSPCPHLQPMPHVQPMLYPHAPAHAPSMPQLHPCLYPNPSPDPTHVFTSIHAHAQLPLMPTSSPQFPPPPPLHPHKTI